MVNPDARFVASDNEVESLVRSLAKTTDTPAGTKGSYFADCERDKLGRCKPSGQAGETSSGNEKKPVPQTLSPEEANARRDLEKIFGQVAKPDGGFTYSAVNRSSPSVGFALSPYPERSFAKDFSEVKPLDIIKYIAKNRDILTQSNHYLGAWHDPASGKVFLDVSVVNQDRKAAEKLAKEKDQIAYFDLEAGKSVTVNADATSGGAAKELGNGRSSKPVFSGSERRKRLGRHPITIPKVDGKRAFRGGSDGSKSLVGIVQRKGAGTCEPGERADITGCTPATDDPAKEKPSKQDDPKNPKSQPENERFLGVDMFKYESAVQYLDAVDSVVADKAEDLFPKNDPNRKAKISAFTKNALKEAEALWDSTDHEATAQVTGTEAFFGDGPVKQVKPKMGDWDFSESEAYVKSLPKEVMAVVSDYTDTLYERVNPKMRSCPPDFDCLGPILKGKMERLDAVISKAPKFKQPVDVYRGMSVSTDVAKSMIETMTSLHKEGKSFSMPSFTSTTIDPEIALNTFSGSKDKTEADFIFRIQAKSGLFLGGAGKHGREQEILQSHKCKYKVVGMDNMVFNALGRDHKRKVIHLEEVLDE